MALWNKRNEEVLPMPKEVNMSAPDESLRPPSDPPVGFLPAKRRYLQPETDGARQTLEQGLQILDNLRTELAIVKTQSATDLADLKTQTNTEIAELRAQLELAMGGLRDKNAEIERLSLTLAEARNDATMARSSEREVLNECGEWRAMFDCTMAFWADFQAGASPAFPRRRKKKNGPEVAPTANLVPEQPVEPVILGEQSAQNGQTN